MVKLAMEIEASCVDVVVTARCPFSPTSAMVKLRRRGTVGRRVGYGMVCLACASRHSKSVRLAPAFTVFLPKWVFELIFILNCNRFRRDGIIVPGDDFTFCHDRDR